MMKLKELKRKLVKTKSEKDLNENQLADKDLRRWFSMMHTVTLVLGLGLKAKFCGLGLAIGWPWPWDCGLGLRSLALAKNSRPKSWRTTMFTMNFHRLE